MGISLHNCLGRGGRVVIGVSKGVNDQGRLLKIAQSRISL